jgi:hypothetical protein
MAIDNSSSAHGRDAAVVRRVLAEAEDHLWLAADGRRAAGADVLQAEEAIAAWAPGDIAAPSRCAPRRERAIPRATFCSSPPSACLRWA